MRAHLLQLVGTSSSELHPSRVACALGMCGLEVLSTGERDDVAVGWIAAIVKDMRKKVAEQDDTKGVLGEVTTEAMIQVPVALLAPW